MIKYLGYCGLLVYECEYYLKNTLGLLFSFYNYFEVTFVEGRFGIAER
jgi:hypothetical protein